MTGTTKPSTEERTARVRALVSAARPRISYRTLAEDVGMAHGTVRQILSDYAPWDTSAALDRIEAALMARLAGRLTAAGEVAP